MILSIVSSCIFQLNLYLICAQFCFTSYSVKSSLQRFHSLASNFFDISTSKVVKLFLSHRCSSWHICRMDLAPGIHVVRFWLFLSGNCPHCKWRNDKCCILYSWRIFFPKFLLKIPVCPLWDALFTKKNIDRHESGNVGDVYSNSTLRSSEDCWWTDVDSNHALVGSRRYCCFYVCECMHSMLGEITCAPWGNAEVQV